MQTEQTKDVTYKPGDIVLLIREKDTVVVPIGKHILVDSPDVIAYFRVKHLRQSK